MPSLFSSSFLSAAQRGRFLLVLATRSAADLITDDTVATAGIALRSKLTAILSDHRASIVSDDEQWNCPAKEGEKKVAVKRAVDAR